MKPTFDSLVDHLMGGGFFLEEAVEILEKTFITRALERTGGNCSAASITRRKRMSHSRSCARPASKM